MRFNAPAGWRLALALALVLPAPALAAPPLHTYTRAEHHMGSRFTFTVVAADSATGQRALRAAFAEVGRLDHLLSFWDSASVVTQINRLAGVRPVAVDAETFALFQRTRRLGQLSQPRPPRRPRPGRRPMRRAPTCRRMAGLAISNRSASSTSAPTRFVSSSMRA